MDYLSSDLTFDKSHSYENPLVLGPLMRSHEFFWVFWNSSSGNAQDENAIGVGKHLDEDDNKLRFGETVGDVLIEAGDYRLSIIEFSAGIDSDFISGIVSGTNNDANFSLNLSNVIAVQ